MAILKILLLFICTFPLNLFSNWLTDWLPTYSTVEKQDFYCPHHCGEWGSESIRKIEWDFIQCLYEADRLTAFIEINFEENRNYSQEYVEINPVEPKFYEKPEDFNAQWYQKMLENHEHGKLILFEEFKSEWTHPNPEKKLKEVAGKGQKVTGKPGQPGYKERVDFGDYIGYYDDGTGKKVPTTIGIIHYSKKGAHIVPGRPKK